MLTILLTGFEPFAGDTINPSWQVAKALDGRQFSGAGGETARVSACCLPCAFGASLQALNQAFDATRPRLVIGLGLAGGRSEIALERIAINLDDARIPDNAGAQPIDVAVIDGAPAAYFSSLPIKAIRHALRVAEIPCSISQTAGTFVCNHVFYGLMHRLAEIAGATATAISDRNNALDSGPLRGGFIHLPYLPAQATRIGAAPSMSLETAKRGVELAIATALKPGADLHEAGGSLD
jgi:pyroglutamyl-peptidase